MTLDKKNKNTTPYGGTLEEWRLTEVERRVRDLDSRVGKLAERTHTLERRADEASLYLTNIMQTVETITGDFKKMDETTTSRHISQQEKWTGFFQKITYLVIGAIITYLFSQFS